MGESRKKEMNSSRPMRECLCVCVCACACEHILKKKKKKTPTTSNTKATRPFRREAELRSFSDLVLLLTSSFLLLLV